MARLSGAVQRRGPLHRYHDGRISTICAASTERGQGRKIPSRQGPAAVGLQEGDRRSWPCSQGRRPNQEPPAAAEGKTHRTGQHDQARGETGREGRMNILLLSMPDSFEHMPAVGIRMPNGALTSLAGTSIPTTGWRSREEPPRSNDRARLL